MPNNLTTYVLENGLTVYFYNDNSKHTIRAELVTKYGGRYKDFILDGKEYHTCDGVAHLIEHFLCEHGKAGNYLSIAGEKLISSNALTSFNMTRFYIDGVENMEETLLAMLTNIYNPLFTEENLKKVKNAIYEEIRRKNDRKFFEYNVKFNESLYHNIKIKSTLGTIEEIKNLDLDTVKACYNAFYRPGNQFLVVAGNFDKEEFLKQIKDFFDKQPIEKHETKLIDLKEPVTVKNKSFKVYKYTSDTYIDIRYKINIKKLSPRERLDLESAIINHLAINFGHFSKLNEQLEKEKIVVGDINYWIEFTKDFLICSIGGYNTDSKKFIDSINNVINKKEFNKELYELEIKETLTRFILRLDSINAIIGPFIENNVIYNYPYLDKAEDFDIPFEKYKKIINSLDFSNYTIGYLINPENKEDCKN